MSYFQLGKISDNDGIPDFYDEHRANLHYCIRCFIQSGEQSSNGLTLRHINLRLGLFKYLLFNGTLQQG